MCKHCGHHHCHQPHHQTVSQSTEAVTNTCQETSCCSSHQDGEGNAGDDDPDRHRFSSSVTHEWAVTGMDCPSCAAKLEKAIHATPGVESATVLFATEKLRVSLSHNASADTLAAIQYAAKKVGFPLLALNQPL